MKRIIGLNLVVLLIFVVSAPSVSNVCYHSSPLAGTAWVQKQKLFASDGSAGDMFGGSVSISGYFAIVGAYGDDDKGDYSGSAYIFKWDGTSWIQQQKLTALDGASYNEFGSSVSISGDFAIVGAHWDNDKGSDSGSAYIFRREDTNWVQQQKLLASDGAAGDMFGGSVSISGDYAIVGAYADDDKGSRSGSAYIFKWDGTSWSQQQKLTALDGASYNDFGSSVSISGDLAIIGADGDNDKGTESGSAYIFRREDTSWVEQEKLLASDGSTGDWFGRSVSISADFAIVGALFDDDKGNSSGSAYIFKREGETWIQWQKLTAADGSEDDSFGSSVSISGDFAIVGALGDDDKGNSSGSAYIFKWDGTSWIQQQKLAAADGATYDKFGRSVSISGNFAIVGALGDDDKGDYSGSAYVFGLDWHVDGVNGDDNNDGRSPETAFATIQKGINSAENDEIVLVYPGVYNETIDFLGKAITVQSAEDAAILQAQDYFAVLFCSGEGPGSILKNFVIENSFMAIFIDGSSPTITNVTIVDNGFGIAAYTGSQPNISNSIFWNNIFGDLFGCQATYSCVQNGCLGPGNLDIDPRFADPEGGDYHLQSKTGRYWPQYDVWILDEAFSPCIDGGDPNAAYHSEPMPNGGRVNMGAYGGTAYASKKEMRWLHSDTNKDGWVNMMDFAMIALDWLRYEPGTSNLPPEVSIIKPHEGDIFPPWESERGIIEIEADAWDSDGSVEWVEFLVNGDVIGEDNNGADGWTTEWQDPAGGNYSLTAEATDDDGESTTSSAVEIRVGGAPR